MSALIILPMWRDISVQDYKTRLSLNNQSYDMIVDTGSNLIMVDGKGSLPKDDSSIFHVTYGGGQQNSYQIDQVQWNDANNVTIPVANVTSSSVNSGKSQNIMGLSPYNKSLFFDAISSDYPAKLAMDFAHGKLYIGNIDRLVTKSGLTYPIGPYPGTDIFSYVSIPLSASDQLAINGTMVPPNIRPDYLLIDVGTTNTIAAPQLYNFFNNIKQNSNTFALSKNNSNLSFTFPANTLITDYLPSDKVLLIGNKWLSQYLLKFDYINHTIEFV